MNSPPIQVRCLLAALCVIASRAWAVEAAGASHYYDELGLRHLTLTPVLGSQVEVSVRWASDPGAMGRWLGQGTRKDSLIIFAASVEEGQDRGTFFVAKVAESKVEISFKPGQPTPQDAGIQGVYRRVSDDKRLSLARKEFQAAEDRLAATLKNASRTWTAVDKPLAADWKSRWPVLREHWMKIAYQAPAPLKPAANQPFASAKAESPQEKDTAYWLRLAEVTALGYYFVQQPADVKSAGGWDGEYDDGFGGHVSLRLAKDGRLRVNLTCTQVNENMGGDLSGQIPAEALKSTTNEYSAEGVFVKEGSPEGAKEVSVMLKRKGGFLWVETKRKVEPPGNLSWFDGIYRWSPVPVE